MAGTPGAEVIGELAPAPGDHVTAKSTYSGFYRTDLDEFLKGKGIKTLILTGVLANCCIQYIAGEAFVRGYHVVVPANCVATFTPKEHDDALAYIKFWFKADVTDSKTLIARLGRNGKR